ncbi:T-complex protein 1 subunit gamma [Patellaria atrata CBS 101060]|uniref:T-complex protein 1 subunit gamma n=1 Tax=Patellaria atrata CBS 101060 TaxID=1346257 RepID=A0A9P4SGN2_9PEZI|nr:T-complex protein 1 subunit gamma [Patellaria atrata CBS 101060]
MQAPVVVMNTATGGERQFGRKAQLSNITAAKTVADIIRSCLGPKAMLKMLLDPMGGIVLTNDGHAILREIEVAHPAAKSMIELSRTQDEEVGDGTTTVIILAGEILAQALPQLERNIHPVIIIGAFKRALADALQILEEISVPVDIKDDNAMRTLISSSIGTKFVSRWSDLMCDLALKAVRTVSFDIGTGRQEIDIKRYARVEKIPGGEIEDSCVLDGVMLNKDITHPKMRRRIENPRILLLDCPLEYKKGESQTAIEISKEDDWKRILDIEEEQIKSMCDAIIALQPDLVITEKGVSDLAQHFLVKANITALRRVRKTDNNRIARATGAAIVNSLSSLQPSDIGTKCALFHIDKIGDEYFTFLTKCQDPKACTILLRGPSKDILNEVERNLHDAMGVARNVLWHPRLCPGGGAAEMAIAVGLERRARNVEGVAQWPYRAVAEALEVIPRTLVQNAGASPIRILTQLRAKHAEALGEEGGTDGTSWGIDGDKGVVVDMREYGVWEPLQVKAQSLKTAVESACLLLRVDDIVAAKAARQLTWLYMALFVAQLVRVPGEGAGNVKG